jgi:archaellum biogenesis ATPase FlaH
MPFNSGFSVYQRNNKLSFISSGDSTLDKLLGGGFHKNLVYLLYGDKKKTTDILLTTAVIIQNSIVYGGLGDGVKVAFVDGNNRFNPYNVSKFAVTQHLSPQKVLESIVIARAFTWEQMIELLENKLSTLEHVKVVLISGITSLLQNYEKQTFEDLLRAIDGIKRILEKTHPLIILTAPLNEYSLFRPKGGQILSHFGNVLILINDDERFTEYILIQHPFLAENRLLKWKPRKSKRNLSNPLKNTTIDCWF